MQRRHFLSSSLAAAAVALTPGGSQAQAPSKAREYYELRKYQLRSGPQIKLTNSYVSDALIPALNRLGFTPIGAF